MGVDVDFYVVHGRKIPFNNEFLEKYDEMFDLPNTPDVIIDGMVGDYIVLGKIQCRCSEYDDGDEWVEVDVLNLAKEENSYKESFRKTFPEFAHWMDEPFKLLAFKHYS